MAYKVEYAVAVLATNKKKGKRTDHKRNAMKLLFAVLLIALAVLVVSTDILIPGDAEVTKTAVENLVSDLKEGNQVVDAFAVFCQTVLHGG